MSARRGLRWAVACVMVLWLAAACSRPAAAPTPATAATPARSAGPAAVGQQAPEFALPTTSGGMARLSDYRGKVVIVNLWATWCGPCRMEVPELVAAYERYQERGFTVLAINQGEPLDLVAAFAGEFGMRFPVLLDEQARMRASYPYRGIPTSFIVDREGVVRKIWVGTMPEEAITQLVEPLLGS